MLGNASLESIEKESLVRNYIKFFFLLFPALVCSYFLMVFFRQLKRVPYVGIARRNLHVLPGVRICRNVALYMIKYGLSSGVYGKKGPLILSDVESVSSLKESKFAVKDLGGSSAKAAIDYLLCKKFLKSVLVIANIEEREDERQLSELYSFFISFNFVNLRTTSRVFTYNDFGSFGPKSSISKYLASYLSGNYLESIDSIKRLIDSGQADLAGYFLFNLVKKFQNFTNSKSKMPLLEYENFDLYLGVIKSDLTFSDEVFQLTNQNFQCDFFAGKAIDDSSREIFALSDNWHFTKNLFGALEGLGYTIFKQNFSEIERQYNDSILYYSLKSSLHSGEMSSCLKNLSPQAYQSYLRSEIVFVEWGSYASVWATKYVDSSKKIIVRVHSFEVFSPLIYFVNWSRVSHLIFVAEHVRSILVEQLPQLAQIPFSILSNINQFSAFELPKKDDAKYTLGMAVFNDSNKDPIFALKILVELLRKDSRWKLRLAGRPFKPGPWEVENRYMMFFYSFINRNGLGDRVIFDGYQDNMPEWYRGVGFILSCSVREGTHESLLEGIASGSVPVIRDWPMVKRYKAAATVYADFAENIYETVDEAVSIIVSVKKDSLFLRKKVQPNEDVNGILKSALHGRV